MGCSVFKKKEDAPLRYSLEKISHRSISVLPQTCLVFILGIGRFGEFSTFTFEILNNQLSAEMKRKNIEHSEEHIFAEHDGISVMGLLRTYGPTNPGKRSLKYRLDLVSAEKDVDVDRDGIAERARERYQINVDPQP